MFGQRIIMASSTTNQIEKLKGTEDSMRSLLILEDLWEIVEITETAEQKKYDTIVKKDQKTLANIYVLVIRHRHFQTLLVGVRRMRIKIG